MSTTMDYSSANFISYPFFTFFFSLLPLVILHYLIRTLAGSKSKLRLPPSPPSLPIIGHGHLLNSKYNLPEALKALSRRYGPMIQIRIGSSTFVVLSNSTLAKEIFKTQDINFVNKYEPGPCEYNIYKGSGFITGPYGPYWRFMKKLCATKLLAGHQLDRFNHIREQEFENLVRKLIQYSGEGEPCDLKMELGNLLNVLLLRMTMSKRFSENSEEPKRMRKLIVDIMLCAVKFSPNEAFGFLRKIDLFGHGKKLTDSICRFDEAIEQIMKEYEKNRMKGLDEERDLMSILIETYRDTNSEIKITRNQIKYFLLELLMASIDVTAAAMQWAMAELFNNPSVFNKLRSEIDTVVGSSRLVKESDVPKLPYLRAVIKESLRLHPPAAVIHRQCMQDCKINGYDVLANTKILVNAYAIMRDPQEWENPNEFMPERFLVNSGDNQIKQGGQDFRFLAFGGGRRGCSGITHAHVVMHATIGALVQCFDWKIDGDQKVNASKGSGYLGATALPLMCYPVTRFNPFN